VSTQPIANNNKTVSTVIFQHWKITNTYKFPMGTFESIETSYLLALPTFGNLTNLKGIVAYFHPTVFDKQNVPSINYFKD
jgi:hypothetical protein